MNIGDWFGGLDETNKDIKNYMYITLGCQILIALGFLFTLIKPSKR